ncbi:MAG TPA: TIGR04255 family protein [Puia sp.]|jgi:uncharacterized protein (TIGR04255 family)
MRLPSKITPDSISDAVVEIRYLSDLPFEILLGLFVDAFDESYTYISRPPKPPRPGIQESRPRGLVINLGGEKLLYNDKVTIQLRENAFVFSCLDKYIGWKDFRPEIEKAMEVVANTGKVTKWTRVGLRYISEYPKTDLKGCTNFDFTFGLPNVRSSSTAFRTEFNYNEARVILNLSNQIPVARQQALNKLPEVVSTSIIDIDVIQETVNELDIDRVMGIADKMHLIEKEVFFTLLTESFLQTLNPEY